VEKEKVSINLKIHIINKLIFNTEIRLTNVCRSLVTTTLEELSTNIDKFKEFNKRIYLSRVQQPLLLQHDSERTRGQKKWRKRVYRIFDNLQFSRT